MIDLLPKTDKISIADKECYVNQIKNKSGEFSEERLAFGISYQPLLALRLLLEGRMNNMKKCLKCKEIKIITEFFKDKKKEDSFNIYCKECEKKRGIKNYLRNKEKYGGLYFVWKNFRQRCFNPKAQGFKRYGGRGITICKEWEESFLTFYEWAKDKYQKGLTIDRKDNDGNYCPNNCRFVTIKTNIENRSTTVKKQ